MPRIPIQRRYRQQGIAIVEFAATLPILLLLMFATAEIGRILMQYNTLAKGVRDGARYAASKAAVGTTRIISITPQLLAETSNLVVTGQISGGSALLPGLTVGNVSVTDAGNGYVAVTAAYTYTPMLGASLPMFGFGSNPSLSLPLTANVIMRAL